MKDIQAKPHSRKAMFFLGDWRAVYPKDFEVARDISEEMELRKRVREQNEDIDPTCSVCGEEIPAYEPDFLVINGNERFLAHRYCLVVTVSGMRVVERHCVGGIEIERDVDEQSG